MQRIVVIGASSGGLDALRVLVAALPADFPSPIAVVLHTAPHSPGVLDSILSRSGLLPAVYPDSGERLHGGRIYLAPADYHLLIEPGRVRLSKGPRENRFRPAVDPLFRTAAQVFGPAAIGVVLSGNLDDGAAGLWAIKRLGGTAIVQDPADAMFPSMPANVLQYVKTDHRVPLRAIAPLLVRLTAEPVDAAGPRQVPERMEIEVKVAREEDPLKAGIERIGEPSPMACPECHGVLRQWNEDGRFRYRCHTGHAFSADSLLAEISGRANALRDMLRGSTAAQPVESRD